MDIVQITVDQAHSDTFKARLGNLINHRFNFGPVKRDHHLAQCIHPLTHGETHLARQKRVGQSQVQVVLFKPAFGAHLDNIAKAFGCDERSLGATSFNQRIGCQGGPMDDAGDCRCVHTALGTDLDNAVHDGPLGRIVGRKNLDRGQNPMVFQHHVRKRSADVYA